MDNSDWHARSEKDAAKAVGADTTPASGALPFAKGDAVDDYLRYEVKSTKAKTMRVELGWLRKITEEALSSGRDPALIIQFYKSSVEIEHNGRWVALPAWLHTEMAAAWLRERQKENEIIGNDSGC